MKLAIVTISYRDPHGLAATLESLQPWLREEAASWTHVVVDSSPEENESAVAALPAAWPLRRIKLPPVGIYASINAGIAASDEELVWVLNGGDRLQDPRFLAELVSEFEQDPALDLVCAGADLERGGKFLYPRHPGRDLFSSLWRENLLTHPGMIYRRRVFEKVGNYSQKFPIAGDYHHHLRVYLAGMKAKFFQRSLVRFDMGGASSDVDRSIRDRRAVVADLKSKFPSPAAYRRFRMGTEWEAIRLKVIKWASRSLLAKQVWIAWQRRRAS